MPTPGQVPSNPGRGGEHGGGPLPFPSLPSTLPVSAQMLPRRAAPSRREPSLRSNKGRPHPQHGLTTLSLERPLQSPPHPLEGGIPQDGDELFTFPEPLAKHPPHHVSGRTLWLEQRPITPVGLRLATGPVRLLGETPPTPLCSRRRMKAAQGRSPPWGYFKAPRTGPGFRQRPPVVFKRWAVEWAWTRRALFSGMG